MFPIKTCPQQMPILCLVILICASFTFDTPQAWSEPSNFHQIPVAQGGFAKILRFLGIGKRPPYPEGRRRGGGTYTTCPVLQGQLTALIPQTNIGLTVAGHPTFWFYVPNSSRRSWLAEFVLNDDNGNRVYETPPDFKLTETGIISFQLPETLPPLEYKKYKWVFSLICSPQDPSANLTVHGLIERVQPEARLKTQLEQATPREQVFLYANAENGLWYEAVTSLAKLRLDNPKDIELTQNWIDLLNSVCLDEISTEPLTSCCKLEQQQSQ